MSMKYITFYLLKSMQDVNNTGTAIQAPLRIQGRAFIFSSTAGSAKELL